MIISDAFETAGEPFDPVLADVSLFGCWEAAPSYATALPEGDPLADRVRTVVLETKSVEALSVSPADELRQLLNEMTMEIREQFAAFRKMRTAAELLLEGGDDAAQKLARADIKAATDAMSLIVRTLEKVDSLQRQLARDREDEAERVAEAGGYGEARDRFVGMIKDRAHEEGFRLYAIWKRDGPPAWVADRLEREATQPAHDKAGSRDGGGQGGDGFQANEPDPGEDRRGA